MSGFIRVKDTSGGKVTVPAGYEQAFGLTPLDEPAVDRFGRPLPPKPRTSPVRESAEAPAEATPSKEKN